jgi:hypothetical protein
VGRADELFARIRDKGAAEVHLMIAAPVVEELFLDYKRSSTTLPARKLSDDDRKNLSKAISGFANSDGGVIVWGVDCRTTPDGDIPTGPIPISNAIAFKTLLDGAVGGLTLPAHSGVENIALPEGTGSQGFVITHIPVGSSVPYQALYPKHEYYIRAGSNFLPTPHSVLAGLFGRVPQPITVPVIRLRNLHKHPGGQDVIYVHLEVHIRNDGRGFAEDIFCVFDIKTAARCAVHYPRDEDSQNYFSWRTSDGTRDTIHLHGLVLPPGTEYHAIEVQLDIPSGSVGEILIAVSCGARGGPSTSKEIRIPASVVTDVYTQYTTDFRGDTLSMRATHVRADAQIRDCLPK